MKINEFEQEVEKLGFQVEGSNYLNPPHATYITLNDEEVAYISYESKYILDTNYDGFKKLLDYKQVSLLQLLFELASTDVKDRYEEVYVVVKFKRYLENKSKNQESFYFIGWTGKSTLNPLGIKNKYDGKVIKFNKAEESKAYLLSELIDGEVEKL